MDAECSLGIVSRTFRIIFRAYGVGCDPWGKSRADDLSEALPKAWARFRMVGARDVAERWQNARVTRAMAVATCNNS